MSETKFRTLIDRVYIKPCVTLIEQKYPFYYKMPINRKEEAIRRIHIIYILMNTIKMQAATEIENLSRKRRDEGSSSSGLEPKKPRLEGFADELVSTKAIYELEAPRSPEYRAESPTFEEYRAESPDYCEITDFTWEEMGGNFDYEEDPDEEGLRFSCAALMEPNQITYLLTQHRIDVPQSFPVQKIHILDKEKRSLIFLTEKTLEDKEEELRSLDLNMENVSIISVDFVKATIISNRDTGLNIDSAKYFLAKRKQEMIRIYGMTKMDVEISTEGLISDFMLVKRMEWEKEIGVGLLASIPETPTKEQMGAPKELPRVVFKDVINGLEDIFETRKNFPQAVWTGKILPHSATNPIILSMDTDKELLLELATHMKYTNILSFKGKESDKELLLKIFDGTRRIITSNGFDNFNTIKVKKTMSRTISDNSHYQGDDIKHILDGVGYELKGKKSADKGLKQPTYDAPKLASYPWWMVDLFKKECEESGYSVLSELTFDEEPPEHPIDCVSSYVCSELKDLYTSLNAACTASRYMNVCSRLGGAYMINISSSNKAHSSVSIMPIYFHGKREDMDAVRVLSGCIIRGPHHVRDATDKINYIQIERVADWVPETMLKKGLLLEGENGKWFICKNSLPRIYPTYGSFMHDLLFLPANFIGESLFGVNLSGQKLQEDSRTIVTENKDFLSQRITEITFMGLVGTSQEEGYFSGYRMLYMILLELSRSNFAGLVNKEGFFESLNECVLNNSYVLFTHGNLLHTLKFIESTCNIDKNFTFRD